MLSTKIFSTRSSISHACSQDGSPVSVHSLKTKLPNLSVIFGICLTGSKEFSEQFFSDVCNDFMTCDWMIHVKKFENWIQLTTRTTEDRIPELTRIPEKIATTEHFILLAR